jgi:hypothetical protein
MRPVRGTLRSEDESATNINHTGCVSMDVATYDTPCTFGLFLEAVSSAIALSSITIQQCYCRHSASSSE